jgi:hypothetical protein
MAHTLEHKSDEYHGSDNYNGHYFVLQDSTAPALACIDLKIMQAYFF